MCEKEIKLEAYSLGKLYDHDLCVVPVHIHERIVSSRLLRQDLLGNQEQWGGENKNSTG